MKALAPTSTGLTFEVVEEDCDAESFGKNDKLCDFQFTTRLYFSSHDSPKIIGLDGVLITLNVIVLLCHANETSSGFILCVTSLEDKAQPSIASTCTDVGFSIKKILCRFANSSSIKQAEAPESKRA